MRAVDLALFADALAAQAARVAAELERTRNLLRHAAIEREARSVLDPGSLERLERLGALARLDARRLRSDAVELAGDLAALRELQAWTEARLAEAREETSVTAGGRSAGGDESRAAPAADLGAGLRASAARSRGAA